MVSVDELRSELVSLGMEQSEADSIKGKANLVNKIEELKVDKESEDIFDDKNIVVEEDEAGEVNELVEVESEVDQSTERPEMTDIRWSDWVLSHLDDSEKIKGHPKTDSLRRLTELLVGKVVDIDIQQPQSPNRDNDSRATVVVHVIVSGFDGRQYRAGASADVFPGNTEQLYAKFASATADTRAEGRALRKILRLINVVTAEEVVDEQEICDPNDQIAEAQITMIKQMCSTAKLDINIDKLLKMYDLNIDNLRKASKSKAKQICKDINSYQETGVPEHLVGYEEQGWL